MRRTFGQRTLGFTLIEMMVAIVVFLIFVGAIYGIYHAARASAETTQQREDVYQTARVLLTQINTELCSAYQPASAKASSLTGEDTQEGADQPPMDTLTFRTTAHLSTRSDVPSGDVCQVTYRMHRAENNETPGLYLEENVHPGLEVDGEQHEPIKLSDRVIGFNVKYLAKSGEEWLTEWIDQKELPAAVRIEVMLQSEEKNAKPITVSATANLTLTLRGGKKPEETTPQSPAAPDSTPEPGTTPPPEVPNED